MSWRLPGDLCENTGPHIKSQSQAGFLLNSCCLGTWGIYPVNSLFRSCSLEECDASGHKYADTRRIMLISKQDPRIPFQLATYCHPPKEFREFKTLEEWKLVPEYIRRCEEYADQKKHGGPRKD